MSDFVFKKRKWRIIFTIIDWFGYLFFKSEKIKIVKNPKILISRLDQMGDVIQTLPLLKAILEKIPDAEVHFLTNAMGEKVLNRFAPDNLKKIIVWDCPWFLSVKSKSKLSIFEIGKIIRNEKYDYIFDLKGDFRLIVFFKVFSRAGLLGNGTTGGGFLLNYCRPENFKVHAVENNLSLLKGLNQNYSIDINSFLEKHSHQLKKINETKVLVLHPDAGTEAKKWEVRHFVSLANKLKKSLGFEINLVGLNQSIGKEIEHSLEFPIKNYMGKTTFSELCNILAAADGLVSNDSGPAHLMTLLGKPVWILWSGTADSSIWKPIGRSVHLFENKVPCAPCSLPVCPVQGHPCLEKIEPEEVFDSIENFYRSI